MCLHIKDTKVKVAKRNIICFKYGRKLDGRLQSPFIYHFFYDRNKTTPSVEIEGQHYKIERGYHTCKRMINDAEFYFQICVIPKGVKYYEGGINDSTANDGYTSERLVWFGSAWNPLNWIKAYLWRPKKVKDDKGSTNKGEQVKQGEHSKQNNGVRYSQGFLAEWEGTKVKQSDSVSV